MKFVRLTSQPDLLPAVSIHILQSLFMVKEGNTYFVEFPNGIIPYIPIDWYVFDRYILALPYYERKPTKGSK